MLQVKYYEKISDYIKENLEELSKEQMIYLIWIYRHVDCIISETLVSESKMELDPEAAIDNIRDYLSEMNWISLYSENLGTYIDFKMGKIFAKKHKKKVLGE